MSITIKDVAREANVSPSTVSRVISNNPQISEKTKNAVEYIIKKLNYHPNPVARRLANKTTNVIGIVLTSEVDELNKNSFFIQLMTGISSYAKQKGYYIMYTFCLNYDEELKSIKHYVNDKLVDGIVLGSANISDKCIEYLKKIDFPFVIIGRPKNAKEILWVDNDNLKAIYNIVSKFLLNGHKKIAFIGSKTGISGSKDRLSGYIQAHNVNGVNINKDLIRDVDTFKEEYGYKAMNEIVKKDIPSAIVTADDTLAFGAIRALKESVIENVMVVGFNNILQSAYYRPSLTSVDVNAGKVGYYACKLLVDRLKNNIKEDHYIIETSLVERETTRGIKMIT